MAATIDIAFYKDALLILGTAGVVVPLVHRLRVSPILGFLAAGAVLGPKGLGALSSIWPPLRWLTVENGEDVARIAEFGVVFLLFLIGLELSLARLKTMRRLVFGLGSLQVAVSTLLLAGAIRFVGANGRTSLIVGLALALSSTAIVIEILAGQQRLSTTTGRASFSVLLLQDLAVVPVIMLVGILAGSAGSSIPIVLAQALLQGAAVIALIVLLGRLVLRPLFRIVASTRSDELFMATTLFVAVGTSVLSGAAGLSMALGAFVAGLMLAETEFRRAIEATIEPFKGLLLGVFFFSVGTNLDMAQLLTNPLTLVAAALGLIVLKAAVLALLSRGFNVSWPAAVETGLLLGPGGEFAYVVLGLAMAYGLVDPKAGSFTLAVVSLTMAAIPACGALGRHLARRLAPPAGLHPDLLLQPPQDDVGRAIIIGHGRVGQLVADMLGRHGIDYIATDRDPIIVTKWRRQERPIYYGDARQPAFLKRCGIDSAAALIITIHTQAEIDEIVKVARALRPDLVIVSRARDASHARHLYELGVNDAVPETIEASLQLSEAALVGLGVPMGPVIASIHERRDEFRHELQGQASAETGERRGIRAKTTGSGS